MSNFCLNFIRKSLVLYCINISYIILNFAFSPILRKKADIPIYRTAYIHFMKLFIFSCNSCKILHLEMLFQSDLNETDFSCLSDKKIRRICLCKWALTQYVSTKYNLTRFTKKLIQTRHEPSVIYLTTFLFAKMCFWCMHAIPLDK